MQQGHLGKKVWNGEYIQAFLTANILILFFCFLQQHPMRISRQSNKQTIKYIQFLATQSSKQQWVSAHQSHCDYSICSPTHKYKCLQDPCSWATVQWCIREKQEAAVGVDVGVCVQHAGWTAIGLRQTQN